MKSLLKLALCAYATYLVLFSMDTLRAQEARGTIAGKVADSTGAVVPRASVKIANLAMGTTAAVETNDAGLFQAPYLIPGAYRIVAEAAGFKQYVRENILLRVGDLLSLDIQLQVGAVGEQVTVTAESPVLDTATASMGQVVDSRRITELPTPHGDPYALIGLAGGASFTGDPKLDRPFEPTHIVGYAMNGTRGNRSDITIDGVASASRAGGNQIIASYVPPADLVDEIKVQTSTFDASMGNTEGGVTNVSVKSGTNGLHGTVYYWAEPKELAANDFFGNATGTPAPDTYSHRWGGTAGGPVYLPKLYNGRNKTFFMYGFEGIHDARPRNNGTPTVPTAAMKQGDFSALLNLNTPIVIYNPFTRRAVGSGRYQEDPFPGNKIPCGQTNPATGKDYCSPVALAALKYFPDPITAGRPDGTGNYAQPDLKETAKYATNTIRIDHVISDTQRIFGRASWYDRNSDYNNFFHNLATGTQFAFISRQATLDDVYVFNPTTVLNVRYGFSRFIRDDQSNLANHGFDLTSLGFPAGYNNLISANLKRFPGIDLAGYQGTRVNSSVQPNDVHSAVATLHKSMGTHAVKTGVEFRDYRQTFGVALDASGRFNFDSTWTKGPLDNSNPVSSGNVGYSVAALLLGLPSPSNSYISVPADYAERSTTWGLFVQDDWRVSSNLTLTLGVRYELETALTERHDKSVAGFDFSAVQPIEQQVRANYATNPIPEVPVSQFNVRGGLLFAGVGGQGDALYETPKRDFMPRFGFAYKLGAQSKTVIRGGYGIFYGFLGMRRGDVIQSGFSQDTLFQVTSDNLRFTTWDNPLALMPNGLQQPAGNANGIQTSIGQNASFFNQLPLAPYMQRWELGVQHEFAGGFMGEVSYVGNRGTHIEIGRNLNALPQRYLSLGSFWDQTTKTKLTQNIPNPFYNVLNNGTALANSRTMQHQGLLVPLPQFGSVNTTTNDGYSWYHSLQLRLERRFSKGYTLNGSYTFSKFMEATSYLNADEPRPNRGISDMDRPHRVSISGIYELPFGKGRPLLSQGNAMVSKLIGGWQVSGVYAFQSGAPLSWGNVFFTGMDPHDLVASNHSLSSWFNTPGFVALRNGSGANAPVVRQNPSNPNSQPVWVDYNDPCKFTLSCAIPLTTLMGFDRDSTFNPGANFNVRTFPQRFGFLRSDTINNYDFAVIKNTGLTESKNLQLRIDLLNALNHPLFPGPNTDPTSPNFGTITASTQANYSRRVQLGIKFLF